MFQSARIKLTAWYLVIITLISVLFSFFIFKNINTELTRIETFQKERQREREILGIDFPRLPRSFIYDPEIIPEARRHLIYTLIFVNTAILGLSALAGYFLAGITLRPIKEMIDEQNRFIADASHELRTPITSLKAGTEVTLRDKNLSLKDAKDQLLSNLQDTNSLQSLIDNLIKLSQYHKLNNNFKFEKVFLKETINDAIKKVAGLSKGKKINITNKVEDIYINAEKNSLTELFVILLDNAIKYSPEKGEVKFIAKKTDGHVIIRVIDNGEGIKKDDIPHVFERFFRGDKSRSNSQSEGYGLGLSVAKEIVNKHGGSITVESEEKIGSTFIIQLPTRL